MKNPRRWCIQIGRLAAFAGLIAVLLSGCASAPVGRDVLFQTSTIDALLDGVYDADFTCAQLRTHGDFGLGTFQALDGEMIVVEGRVLRVRSDGGVEAVSPDEKTPFASVTFFEPDQDESIPPESATSIGELYEFIDSRLASPNLFYAVRVDGRFSHVKTRSVPRQTPPYRPLAEVAKTQPVFEFRDVEGTLIGFRCPEFVKGVNVTGYHLHFLTRDGSGGGHLLECTLTEGRLRADETSQFQMRLPETGAFLETDLARDRSRDLNRVEK